MTTAFATEPTTHAIDEARAAAFGQQIFSTIVSACATMLIGVGHRTGIFDTLANLPPVTSAELATHTGLQERYVRELLSPGSPSRESSNTTRRRSASTFPQNMRPRSPRLRDRTISLPLPSIRPSSRR